MRIIESDVFGFVVRSSEEPDSKRARTDDQSAASGQMMQDMQANNAGYNYNNWYQVSPASVSHMIRVFAAV